MHEPLMQEVDRSTSVPMPTDRPLSYAEQRRLWRENVPESVRQPRHPETSESQREKAEAARACARSWGWLLNRLDWDREYLRGVPAAKRDFALTQYGVPDCCQPGKDRVSLSALRKLRQGWNNGADYDEWTAEKALERMGRL